MNHIEQVSEFLKEVMSGEEPPSFKSPEFAELIKAIGSVATTPRQCEFLGRLALDFLLLRLSAKMHAQRELAILRTKGSDPC